METRDIEKYTNDYLNHDFEAVMVKFRRKKVLEVLNKYRAENILEIGCGAESIFDYYKDYNHFTIVEPSETFCTGIRKSENYNSKITVINDFLENRVEELKERNFDFIILSSLLHEVTEPENLLECVKSLCNSKTVVHINVPNSESFHLLWAYKSGLISHIGDLTATANVLQQHTTFNMKTLAEMVENSHFSIIDNGSYFIKPFNHKKMQTLLNENILDENLLEGLYDMVDYFPNNGAEIFVNCRVKS